MVFGILKHLGSEVSHIVLEIPIEERLAVSSDSVGSVHISGLQSESWVLFLSRGTVVILGKAFLYCLYITGNFNTPDHQVPVIVASRTVHTFPGWLRVPALTCFRVSVPENCSISGHFLSRKSVRDGC